MNLSCPNCREKTIQFWRGFWATGAAPAKCSNCGTLSAPSRLINAAEGLLQQLAIFLVIFLSFYIKSWLPLLLFFPAYFLIHAGFVSLNRFSLVSLKGRKIYRAMSYVVIVAFILSLLFLGYELRQYT